MDTLSEARVQDVLRDNGMAAQVGPQVLDELLAVSEARRHPPGRYLGRRGEVECELLLLLDGSIEVSAGSSDGRRSIAWFLGPGEWMNIIPVVDRGPVIHDFRAHTEAWVLHTPGHAVRTALGRDSRLSCVFMQVLCARSRRMYDSLAAAGLLPLRARVARLLLMLMEQHGGPCAGGIEIRLRLSQDEFADMLAVTRQSLNRELKALEQAGAVSLAYSRIIVRDEAQLRRQLDWPSSGV